MVRYYTFYVTDDKLLASPYVRRFNFLHDLTLQLNKPEEVRFLLQTPITPLQQSQLQLLHETSNFDITNIKVRSYKQQSIITATFTPKELGIVRVGISFPSEKRASPKMSPSALSRKLHLGL